MQCHNVMVGQGKGWDKVKGCLIKSSLIDGGCDVNNLDMHLTSHHYNCYLGLSWRCGLSKMSVSP